MINKIKKLDKIYENFIGQLSRFSASFISAGIWSSILCASIGLIIMLVLYFKGDVSPTIYKSALYIIKSGASTLLLGTICALIIEFVKTGNAGE